mmetsp:Transcript_18572/g.40193  ORF Transcript_18572/g.40193 Transcript_18572/m.40193 type:complete len:420 (+) Transcript_18572:453-1712(+)
MGLRSATRTDTTDDARASGGAIGLLAASIDEVTELDFRQGVVNTGGLEVDTLAYHEIGPLGRVGNNVLGGMLSLVEELLFVEIVFEIVGASIRSNEMRADRLGVTGIIGLVLRGQISIGAIRVLNLDSVGSANIIRFNIEIERVGNFVRLGGGTARGLLNDGHVLNAAAHGRARYPLAITLVDRVAQTDIVHHVANQFLRAVGPREADAVRRSFRSGEDAPSLLDVIALGRIVKIMATDVRGGVTVVNEAAVYLGIIGEAAHDRVEIAASLEVHISGVAIQAPTSIFVVLNAGNVFWKGDQSLGAHVRLEALDASRVHVPIVAIDQLSATRKVTLIGAVSALNLNELRGRIVFANGRDFCFCCFRGEESSVVVNEEFGNVAVNIEVGYEVGVGAVDTGKGGDGVAAHSINCRNAGGAVD